jgi:ketosteroid isomerase-like protein
VIDLARRGLEAFNRTVQEGTNDYYDYLDPEIEFVPITSFLDGASYHGVDEVRAWIADLRRDWETYELIWDDIRQVGDDRVLALGSWRARGRRGGVETSFHNAAWLIQFRDQKQLRLQTFTDRARALEAAGLRE